MKSRCKLTIIIMKYHVTDMKSYRTTSNLKYFNYPLARPMTSFLSNQNCPSAYKPRSSTELLSPLVKNLMVPFLL